MLIADKYISKIYKVLFSLVIALFLVPWAYLDQASGLYSFMPRKVLFLLMAMAGAVLILAGKDIFRKVMHGAVFVALGLLHLKLHGYLEPHYFFEFIYMEVALLIFFAPTEIKEKLLKISPVILYILLFKAIFFRVGSHIHGGFYSSNTYATYMVYLSFIEIYKKRYWNLVPAVVVMFFAGSKAVYMVLGIVIILTCFSYLNAVRQNKVINKNKIFKNFYYPIFVAFIFVGILSQAMVRTDYYQNWVKDIEPIRKDLTEENMIMYGVDSSEEALKKRRAVLRDIDKQLSEKELSNGPLISNVSMSGGFRVNQYEYMYENLYKYFLVGDTVGSQREMIGHNPHSAPIDFISRLGLLYLILVLVFYKRLFKAMDLFRLNVSILPIMAFQPYGFTIGHSIVILSFVYSLAKLAKSQTAQSEAI
ncbi:MAG: hypothetical protein H7256_12545 [Bdellovibrio sp.]|nr:hypothetical protein [Bdellovibrio sp.]